VSLTRRGPGDLDARDLELTDRLDDRVERTADLGHCRQHRRGRIDLVALNRAVRLHAAAWRDFRAIVAHLTLAGRATCGPDGDLWARDQLSSWLADLDDATANELADELEREGHDVARRLRRTGSP
jgi:hypothetical protein